MSIVVSKAGIHCVGPQRTGYGPFLNAINAAGRRLALVKCRDDFGAIDEALALWPDVLTIGAVTIWDDADYNANTAFNRIVSAAQQNPGIKYWEYFNERNGDYQQQADLYVALLSPLSLLGIGLCLFNCASGTPFRPGEGGGEGDFAYSQIAQACKFAKDGNYKAILGLHEYYTPSDTIGRFVTMADYLEAHDALIPIAITEYGSEVISGAYDQYLSDIKRCDPIYMSDRRVLGCAIWTLGGGGWGDSNYEAMLPALGDYIATVPTEEQPMSSKGGLHLSALGNHPDDPSLPLEISAMQAAHITRAKFMSNGDPAFVNNLITAGIDMAGCVCRLYAAGDNPSLGNPAQFFNEQQAYIAEVYGHGVRMFEIHNEPNLPNEGFGHFWSTPAQFASLFYAPVAQFIRTNFPLAKLVYPGLSPQPDWAAWKPSIASLVSQGLIDLIGVHCYWDSLDNMHSSEQGKTYLRFADLGRDLIITEASHNVGSVTDVQRGAEYGEYIATLPSYINGVFFFISYGPSWDASQVTWVRGNPLVMTAIPGAIGAYVPLPITDREFDHWEENGINISTANPFQFNIMSNRNIKAVTRPKAPPPPPPIVEYMCNVSTDGFGSVSGGGSYMAGDLVRLEWLP